MKSTEKKLIIEPLNGIFSVCKVPDYTLVNPEQPFCFTGSTDEEKSLVCPLSLVPQNVTDREDGWQGFRIKGTLDFSLIGILSGILNVLAENEISVFVVSTFNTDYVFVKQEDFRKAVLSLKNFGYLIEEAEKTPE